MKDPVAEARLERENVQATYLEAVELTSIDVPGSLRNQARFDPLTKSVVERYALKMIDGEQFPAVILFTASNGLHKVVDGNHRIAAASEAERSTIDAYVLQNPEPLTIVRLTRTWNIANGQGLTQEDILEQAIYLCKNTPYTQRDVAKMVGMNERTLGGHLRAREVKDRLFGLGVPADALPKSHLERLSPIKDDAVLAEAARLVIRASIPADKVEALVTEVVKATSEGDRLAVVKGWAVRSRGTASVSGGGRYASAARRVNVSKVLGALHRISQVVGRDPNPATFGLVLAEDIDALRGAYAEAGNRLRKLLDLATAATREVA